MLFYMLRHFSSLRYAYFNILDFERSKIINYEYYINIFYFQYIM